MENKINLEEFMLRQLDLSLNMKSSMETKAVGYLTVDTLILGILFSFLTEIYSKNICALFKKTCLEFFGVSFVIGLFVLVLCAIILFPKRIEYFNFSELKELHVKTKTYESDFDSFLLEKLDKYISANNKTIHKLHILNCTTSIGMILLVLAFVLSCILFFIYIKG